MRGFDDSPEHLAAPAQTLRGGQAEPDLLQAYVSGDLAARTTALRTGGSRVPLLVES